MASGTRSAKKATPTTVASPAQIPLVKAKARDATGSASQTVTDDVLQLLCQSTSRAEAQIKQSLKAKTAKTRRTAKVRSDAEALLSTDVLLDMAKRRHDVGEVLCSHCSKSLRLADVLPSSSALEMVSRTRRVGKGVFVIAPQQSMAAQPSGSAAQPSAGCELAPPQLDFVRDGCSFVRRRLDDAELAAALCAEDADLSDDDAISSQGSLPGYLFEDEVLSPTSPALEAKEKGTGDEANESEIS